MSETKAKNWREWVLTPLFELFILGGSFLLTLCLREKFHASFFLSLLIFYVVVAVGTLVFLYFVRFIFRPSRGIHSYETKPWVFYGWRLHSFLCETNLTPFYMTGILPPILRNGFYRALGAKISFSAAPISGRLLDPYMVTIGPEARVGDDAVLIPHAYSVGSMDLLVLDRIVLEKGAFVGPGANIEPGVTVGEGSMIKGNSVASIKTQIPPGEVWAGTPATKLADIDGQGFR